MNRLLRRLLIALLRRPYPLVRQHSLTWLDASPRALPLLRAADSLRYPAVELLTAVLFLICYLYFGLSWLGLKICVFGFLLIGLIFMDEETGLLPREFTYPGIVLGLGFSWLASTETARGRRFLLRLFGSSPR